MEIQKEDIHLVELSVKVLITCSWLVVAFLKSGRKNDSEEGEGVGPRKLCWFHYLDVRVMNFIGVKSLKGEWTTEQK